MKKVLKKSSISKLFVSLLSVAMIFSSGIFIPNYNGATYGFDVVSTIEAATISYYPACPTSCKSIVDGLKSIRVDSSYANRKQIAILNGYSDYRGTAAQNNNLLSLLKRGKLIKSKTNDPAPSGLLSPIRGTLTRSSGCKTNGQYCDYKASAGTPVYAPADGKVQFRQSYAVNYKKLSSYGNSLYFTSSDGKTTVLMAHLSSFNNVGLRYTRSMPYPCSASRYTSSTVSLATRTVKRGELLGYTGSTGNASGPHIHIEVKQNGKAVSPTSVFKTW